MTELSLILSLSLSFSLPGPFSLRVCKMQQGDGGVKAETGMEAVPTEKKRRKKGRKEDVLNLRV